VGTTPAWNIFIDTGGTFTDCIAQSPEGITHYAKVLSSSSLRGRIVRKIDPYVYSFEAPWQYDNQLLEGFTISIPSRNIRSKLLSVDYKNRILTLEDNIPALSNADFDLTTLEEAPVLAIRLITKTKIGTPFPPIRLRIGTTKGTNALLEQKGAKTLMVLTKGFGDLLRIGTQQRPNLFQLDIPDSSPFYSGLFEVEERMDSQGNPLTPLSGEEQKRLLDMIHTGNFDSVAIALLNSYRNPAHELQLTHFLREHAQLPVSSSVELFPQIHYLSRSQTAVVDAYLSPIISTYLNNIRNSLGEVSIHVMTSAGGLVSYDKYQAKDSLLSGPAGGMIAATHLARRLGLEKVLTFDMGGTSTDTARIDGRAGIKYLTRIDNYELMNPCFAIETVAAGGGSVCWFDGYTLRVGPQSAGASPGPACYGGGGPLTITDVNLLLGKLETGQFEIPISPESSVEALHQLIDEITFKTGSALSSQEVLMGLERIANEKMAEAIRKISVSEGSDPSEYALMTFGGAGGLHGCQLAELLNCKQVIIPHEAGLFSAVGMGQAQISRIATRQVLLPWDSCTEKIGDWIDDLNKELRIQLSEEEITDVEEGFCSLYFRYVGQEKALEIPFGPKPIEDFQSTYKKLYGYLPYGKAIELESIRMMLREKSREPSAVDTPLHKSTALSEHSLKGPFQSNAIPVYKWHSLIPGNTAQGPCIVTAANSTTYVPQHWHFEVSPESDLIIHRDNHESDAPLSQPEEIELELFTNRFYAIAEEMGAQLQRTAFSVNVKERLDFSCALLDADAHLLVNAPHIPVHLGSLGLCARLVRDYIGIGPGDVVITNHPKYGGSHLPDVTLIAGVFTQENRLIGYVINRAHHAEIGGSRPGSMPTDATSLMEEGVVILPQYLIKGGVPQWESLYSLFNDGTYPTRMWAENEADIIAALSSLQKGQLELLELVDRFGMEKIQYFMQLLKTNAFRQLQSALRPWMGRRLSATEFLDDGHRISVQIEIHPNQIQFDFKNTSCVHPNNLNANLSILHSAILYVLRLLVNRDIPLNDGLMQSVQILLPDNSLLHPIFSEDPNQCPAVVGGNTEVSQRLVDTLLKAFELAACSQGTMNNFLFGNSSIGYYETIGGGTGAGKGFHGKSGVHQHMTNTRITDTEELERRYPVRIQKFALRKGSGGRGKWYGGDGLYREIEFLDELDVTLLTQHRYFSPYGMAGGESGKTADHTLLHADGKSSKCPGICNMRVQKGDRLIIETPGGGGYGDPT
jgi:5-oxoprolinase (ATP-hydrolysing)